MAVRVNERERERIGSALAVAAIHAVLGYALLTGLGYTVATKLADDLKLFDVKEPPPPPKEKVIPAKVRTPKPEGAAAPPNLKSTATPIVVPPPPLRFELPPPVIAAPVAGVGSDPSAGASNVPGPGTGSGGIGNGTGSGGEGNGGGGGLASHARWVKGGINPSDYPDRAFDARAEGVVFLRFTVATNGHVSACAVTRSSGNAELDAVTCRLILRRFRYKPARDARGKPVAETITGKHEWSIREGTPGPVEEEPDESDGPPPRP